jgi:hypothetical protein
VDKAVFQPFDDYNVTIKTGEFVAVTTLLLLYHRVREKRWLVKPTLSNCSSSMHALGFEQLQYMISVEIVVHEYLVLRSG